MRITGGVFRGRTIPSPTGEGTRPTTDSMRERLFSVLTHHSAIEGARVLDLFAGTGALGYEALSRGATHVVFVDSNSTVCKTLRATAITFGVSDAVTILRADSFSALTVALPESPFNLVFSDAPYANLVANRLLTALGASEHLQASAVVCIEHGTQEMLLPSEHFNPLWHAEHGASVTDILRRQPAEP